MVPKTSLYTMSRDEHTHLDDHVVIVGIEGREALAVASGSGYELLLVDKEHLGGVVAHDVVAPAGEFELLGVVGKGESRHGGADDASESGVGNHIDPRHGGVGIGDNIVLAVVVEAAILVVVIQRTPHTEFGGGFQYRVFDLVLILLVDFFERFQLLLDGEAVARVEAEAGDGAKERAFGTADVVAVEHIDVSSLLMCGPQMFGIGHVADKVRETFAIRAFGIVDNHRRDVDISISIKQHHRHVGILQLSQVTEIYRVLRQTDDDTFYMHVHQHL